MSTSADILSPEALAEIEQGHREVQGCCVRICYDCTRKWPCPTARLLAHARALAARVAELEGKQP